MATCKYCKLDSPDLTWINEEKNVNMPAKWGLFIHGKKHNCQKDKPKEPEKKVRCRNPLCKDLGKFFPTSEWDRHCNKEHQQRTL